MAIISIQSYVTYGYVGNKSAMFPLQRLGLEVWPINTVEFSNHTGYNSWTGMVLGAQQIKNIMRGVEERGVLPACQAVLSGYLGDGETGEAIIDALKRVRQANPQALYCCDPVMGDVGEGFYVREDIPLMFKEKLLPLADILLPNQFELEALTGISIETQADARRAIDLIHAKGPKIVVLTSFRQPQQGDDEIGMLVSDTTHVYLITTPRLAFSPQPNGCGDLTSALFLAHYLKSQNPVQALELTANTVYAVLKTTSQKKQRELALIEAQDYIAQPQRRFTAVKL